MSERRLGLISALICIFLCLAPLAAMAASTDEAKEFIDTDRKCTLSISYCYDGIPITDTAVKLYKIADISSDFQYSLTQSFEATKLALNGLRTKGEWNTVRTTLEAYITGYAIAEDHISYTDSNGQVCFESLDVGLYLATVAHVTLDGTVYIYE